MYRKQNPLCVLCLAEKKTVAAAVVDHIIDAAVRPDLFWEPTNHQSLCMSHNTKKSAGNRWD
jgi:5-methylcytosine-specific restriction protein A